LLICAGPRLALAGSAPSAPVGKSDSIDSTLAGDVMVAPVTVDGEVLFQVRGILAYPASERAAQISARIEALAANPAVVPDSLALSEAPDGTRIAAGDQVVMILADADAQMEMIGREPLARLYAKRIVQAIVKHRAERTSAYLLRSAAYLGVASVALAGFLWLGARLVRRFDRTLDERIKRHLDSLEARSMRIVSATHLWRLIRGLRNFSWAAAVLIAIVLYVDFALHLWPWTRPLAATLWALLISPLRTMGEQILAAIPDLIFLAVLVVVTRYVLKSLRLFFAALAEGAVPQQKFERDWSWPTYRLVRLLVIAFALVVAYPYIPGSQSDAFKGISLFLGVIFSLGSSSVISNVIAGYTMIYRRAFRVGDRVKIGDDVGDVAEARLLVTHLRTPKNEEIVIPNSVILNSSVVNYSTLAREGKLILHATVGIGYETPWRQVEAMLLMAADRCKGVLREPLPFVLQKALGDFAVTYEINVYCDNAQAMARLYHELYRCILDVFNEYGVQIMTPAYEGDPEQPKLVPPEQWFMAPASRTPAAGETQPPG
jgi:small-conductance mechanosensitive channel